MARRYYSSTAARTTLASGVDNSTTTLSVVAVSGWPASYPYTLVLDQDTVNEELVSVTNRSGTTLTVTRGIDGTSAVAHDAGAAVNHGVSAQDFDEPNAFINGTGVVTETLLATNSVSAAKIVDGTITNAKIGASADIAQSKIANLTSDLASKAANPKTVDTKTGSYTLVLGDKDKIVQMNSTNARTITVPTNASVAFAVGTIVHVANINTGTLTIAGASGVTVNEAGGLTLAQWESGSLYQRSANNWVFLKGGGIGAANFSDAATGTYTDSGVDYKYIDYTATGTITITKAGFCDILIIGGGAGGGGGAGAGGGGAGGMREVTNAYLATGTWNVRIGAGGSGGSPVVVGTTSDPGDNGNTTSVDLRYLAPGGGGGAACAFRLSSATYYAMPGLIGGSGGGGASGNSSSGSESGGADVVGYGNNGGSASAGNEVGGGGGGSGAVGGNATSTVGGAGGAGSASDYSGSSVTYAGGGGGAAGSGKTGGAGGSGGGGAGAVGSATGSNATASLGAGGGGGFDGGGNGSGGRCIIRVRTN